jgi:hypothetical protein
MPTRRKKRRPKTKFPLARSKRKKRPRFVVSDSLYRKYRIDKTGREVPVLKRPKKFKPKVPNSDHLERGLRKDPYAFELNSLTFGAWRRLVSAEIEKLAELGEAKYRNTPSVQNTYAMLKEYSWRVGRAWFHDPRYRRRAIQLFKKRRSAGTEYVPNDTYDDGSGRNIHDPMAKVAAKEAAHAFVAGFLKIAPNTRGMSGPTTRMKRRRTKYRIDQFFAPGVDFDGGPLRRRAYENAPPPQPMPRKSMEERARAKAKRLGRPSEWLEIYEEMKEAKAQKNAPKPFGRRQS